MSEFQTTYSTQGGRGIAGYKGAEAGKSFASSAELAAKKKDEDEWAEYARSIGQSPQAFSGLGAAALKSRHKSAFDTWKATRTGKGNIGSLIAGGQ